MIESVPKPISASEPAAIPRPIVKTASPRFQTIVAYSSRIARRCKRTRSAPVAIGDGIPQRLSERAG